MIEYKRGHRSAGLVEKLAGRCYTNGFG